MSDSDEAVHEEISVTTNENNGIFSTFCRIIHRTLPDPSGNTYKIREYTNYLEQGSEEFIDGDGNSFLGDLIRYIPIFGKKF